MPPTDVLAGAPPCRPAQSPFRNHTTPHPTPPQRLIYHPHPGRQASKPSQHRTRNTRSTKHNSTKPSTPTPPCCFSDSPAVPWPNCSFNQQHVQVIHIHWKILLLFSATSSLSCLNRVETKNQSGSLLGECKSCYISPSLLLFPSPSDPGLTALLPKSTSK